jgi:hypothetical protein
MTEFDGGFEGLNSWRESISVSQWLVHLHECHGVVGIHRPFEIAIAGRCRADLAIRLVYPQIRQNQCLNSTIKCQLYFNG